MVFRNDLSESFDHLCRDEERRGAALVLFLIAAFALGYALKSVITGEPFTDYLPLLVASVLCPITIIFSLLSQAGGDEES